MHERQELILSTARNLLLADGYNGITMESIASAAGCPKATMYRYFSCKEDIVITLACRSAERLAGLLRRAAAYDGTSRERAMALGEAVEVFHQLHPGDCRMSWLAMGSVREKASEHLLESLRQAEGGMIRIVREVLVDAVLKRELMLREGSSVERMAFSLWALVDGSYGLIESKVPQEVLGIDSPLGSLHEAFNMLADGYQWRPLSVEWDYHAVIQRVRQMVFPEETGAVYGGLAAS